MRAIGFVAVVCLLSFAIFLTGCSTASFTTSKIGDVAVSVAINPDPPKVGHNTVKIKLTDKSGKTIKDAEIKVISVMPAMPSMGMPEMKSQSDARLAGDNYEAPAHLSMDGNWNIFLQIKSKEITSQIEYSLTVGAKGLSLKGSSTDEPRSSMNGRDEHEKHSDMETSPSAVKISAEKQQLIGVKTDIAKKIRLNKEINTVGRIAHDPELYNAQAEYVAALSSGGDNIISSARTRLEILGMSEDEIFTLEDKKEPDESLLVPGKDSWLYASVYEYELPYIKVGQKITITSPSMPGKELYSTLSSIAPILDPETRTAKIRAKIQNIPKDLLHQIFVNAKISADLGMRLAVLRDSVLDSGTRQIIFVDKGNGYFEPRLVKTGVRAASYVEILSGISEGEKIVTSGNFLIDSESRLKSIVPEGHQH